MAPKQLRILTLLIFFVLGAIIVASNLWIQKVQRDRPEHKVYLPPPQSIEHMVFGYKESTTDGLWLRLIQDMDVCGKEKVKRSSITALHKNISEKKDIKGQEFDEAIFTPLKSNVCDKGWAFQLLDAITNLTPRFRMPYALGAISLSVFLDDHIGAKIIFDKGVKVFPNDWSILYRAAYHYLYELHDLNGAASLLNRAANSGAPDWVRSLASRLYTRTGQFALGIQMLENYKKAVTDNPEFTKQINERIENIKKVMMETADDEGKDK